MDLTFSWNPQVFFDHNILKEVLVYLNEPISEIILAISNPYSFS